MERKLTKLQKEINEKLHAGILVFKFRKTNGTIREARGTLFEGILKNKRESGEIRKADGTSSPKVQVYFDLEKNAWRSFQLGTEIEIVEFYKY